jgi:hypothetical protein
MSDNWDRKPILCLDFDGVLHSYTSKWTHADEVRDGPTPGAEDALMDYIQHFNVQIFSSRSHQDGGMEAMKAWAQTHFHSDIWCELGYPIVKPPALVTLDDRAITFTGQWPTIETLRAFRPWNKR